MHDAVDRQVKSAIKLSDDLDAICIWFAIVVVLVVHPDEVVDNCVDISFWICLFVNHVSHQPMRRLFGGDVDVFLRGAGFVMVILGWINDADCDAQRKGFVVFLSL